MRDFSPSSGYGVLIDNPPYGERLSDRKEIIKLLIKNIYLMMNSLKNCLIQLKDRE